MELEGGYVKVIDVCYNCGKRLFMYYPKFKKLITEKKLTFPEAMNELGLNRYCCRMSMMSPKIFPENNYFAKSTLVVPEPLKLVSENLSEENSQYPGEIKIDESGKLLKRYLTYEGFASDIIKGYNNWIENIIPEQIRSQSLELPNGDTIILDDVEIRKPMIIKTGKSGPEPLYPMQAIQEDLTYSANLYVTLVLMNKKGKVIERDKEKTLLCSIPVMLGSIVCNLYNLTRTQLEEKGECPNDPFGYFVIAGKRRVLQIQEKLRVNTIFNFPSSKGDPLCSITCSTITGTSVVKLTLESNNLIHLKISFKDKITIPVFLIFLAFDFDQDMITSIVLATVRKEWEKKVLIFISSSILDAIKSEQLSEETRDEYITNLFPQMNEGLYFDENTPAEAILVFKLYYLGIMVARFSEVQLGLRPYDDRDDVGNQRFENAGRLLEQLFIKLYKNTIDRIRRKITEEKIKATSLKTIKSNIINNTITADLVKSFKTNNWGIYNTHNKASIVENISEVLNNINIISIYSHLVRINTPARREAKQTTIRLVNMSQLGYIDPVETPEGKNCGLIRAKALTCFISIELDPLPIIERIKPYIFLEYSDENISPCLFNGVFMGWCDGKKVKDIVIKLRRTTPDLKGLAVILDKDNILYIYTDGGRATRPLLIVENGELVIQKKSLWNASFDDLIREGALEYIDAKEQQYITIAMNIEFFGIKSDLGNSAIKINTIVNEGNLYYKTIKDIMSLQDYTHCEIDPTAILGISSSLIPLVNHNQAPRNTLQCNMSRQAVAVYHSNYLNNYEASSKILAFPERPIFETQISDLVGLHEMPVGQSVILAIMPYLGFTQEDAFIFNKASLERGLFNMVFYKTYKSKLVNNSKEFYEVFKGPEEKEGKYQNIDENGIAKIGSKLKQGDVVISKLRVYNNKAKESDRIDTYLNFSEEGIVVKSILIERPDGNVVKVLVKFPTSAQDYYVPQQGDKFACYTPNHEVLTKHGWINISHITHSDELATLKDGKIVYEHPTHIMSYKCDDYIIVSEDKIHFEVTANHRMYVLDNKEYVFKTADSITGVSTHKRNALNKNAKYLYSFTVGLLSMDIDDWLYIFGHLLVRGKTTREGIIIIKKLQHLIFLLDKYNLRYKIECGKIHINSYSILQEIKSMYFVRNYLHLFTKEQAEALLSIITEGKNVVKVNAKVKDLIMTLAFLSNKYANATKTLWKWKVSIYESENTTIDRLKLSYYNGEVYCCSVSTGLLYIRHKKYQEPFWCGNSRYAQKGTIGLILEEQDMPFTVKDGIKPDIIINSLAIPSRMTIGKLIEILASKVGALKGERVNATAFRHFNIEEFMRNLTQYGYSYTGKEKMMSGITGEQISGHVFIGPCYYQALRHHVLDKYMMRSRGAVKNLTRQPIKGRKFGGAIRFGEMERDVTITHGAPALLKERLIVSSDLYTTVLCTTCGNLAISDALNQNVYCKTCAGACTLGRINIPYSFKYFLQTLQGSGITIKMLAK